MSTPVLFAVLAPAVGDTARPAFEQVDAAAPYVNVMDLGVTRGDGIFEAAGIFNGHVAALDAHLRRFANSARIMDLPQPDHDVWWEAVQAAAAAHEPAPELFVKFIMTRGIENGSTHPTAWAYVADGGDHSKERSEGISVVTLSRGYRHDIVETSPWLVQGAKTLSYAVNRSVGREAARRGADDVIFTSTDGYVLEGPSSSVVLRMGDLVRTPRTDQGILAGTTQGGMFEYCESKGLRTEYGLVTVDELLQADSVWLASCSRLAAPVTSIDGRAIAVDHAFTDEINAALLARKD